MDDYLPTPEQAKVINDHNLRVLNEQNVEIRHCETLSFTAFTLFFTAIGWLINNEPSWPKIHITLVWLFIFLAISGTILTGNVAAAERRIDEFYRKFPTQNGFPLSALVVIQSNISAKGLFKTVRKFIPSGLMWLGYIGVGIVILIQGVIMVLVKS